MSKAPWEIEHKEKKTVEALKIKCHAAWHKAHGITYEQHLKIADLLSSSKMTWEECIEKVIGSESLGEINARIEKRKEEEKQNLAKEVKEKSKSLRRKSK